MACFDTDDTKRPPLEFFVQHQHPARRAAGLLGSRVVEFARESLGDSGGGVSRTCLGRLLAPVQSRKASKSCIAF